MNKKQINGMPELLEINDVLQRVMRLFPDMKKQPFEEIANSFDLMVNKVCENNLKEHKNVSKLTGVEAKYLLKNIGRTNSYNKDEIKLLKSYCELNNTLDELHNVSSKWK